MEPDQTQHFVGPGLVPNYLTFFMVFLKEVFENVDFERKKISVFWVIGQCMHTYNLFIYLFF